MQTAGEGTNQAEDGKGVEPNQTTLKVEDLSVGGKCCACFDAEVDVCGGGVYFAE